ncbi:hypothetical protein [Streptomyces thermodiastaticus]|uniref:hypothetical protein n=1 Tax=Streptomyces thermodiastaticus TaxID=44061 RepID=UPI001671DB38|nr:hypothetical protein [Streptomyces thermodiastaticus]MCE7553289.1 hypothetical protein [Streptomyces thermodiastaticus]GHF95065.1 hypothetical protein GCM10018787_49820 [Streptomyces thermodiastaticus]
MSVGYTLKNGHWVWHQTPLKDKESRQKYAAYRANPSTYKVYHYNAKAAARAKAQAIARAAAKAEAERRKKDGILGNIMKGHFNDAWKNAKDTVTDKHRLIDKGVGFLAATGTAFCIASVACGAAFFVIGAGVLFTGGLMAHYAVSSDEERRQGMGKYALGTAKAEGIGILSGSLCGRGPAGCATLGPKAGSALEGQSGPGLVRESTAIIGRTIKDWMF